VFSYVNHPETIEAMRLVRDTVHDQARLIESVQVDAQGLAEIWDEFLPDWFYQIGVFAQDYVESALDWIEDVWIRDGGNNPELRNVLETIRRLRSRIPDLHFPDLDE
jgi:hypothetical protein